MAKHRDQAGSNRQKFLFQNMCRNKKSAVFSGFQSGLKNKYLKLKIALKIATLGGFFISAHILNKEVLLVRTCINMGTCEKFRNFLKSSPIKYIELFWYPSQKGLLKKFQLPPAESYFFLFRVAKILDFLFVLL